MKKYIFLTALFVIALSSLAPVLYAQNTSSTMDQSRSGKGQCADGQDNDNDGLRDFNGVTIAGKKYAADTNCTSYDTLCENGSTTPTCSLSRANTDGFKIEVPIMNPLNVDTIEEAFKKFMDVVVMIAIPVVVIMFIWAGFQYVFAQGNTEAIKKAHNTFLYTLIGALLVLGAWTIAAAVVGTVNLITG